MCLQPWRCPSLEADCADTLVLDFHSPDLWEINFCCFYATHLWYFCCSTPSWDNCLKGFPLIHSKHFWLCPQILKQYLLWISCGLSSNTNHTGAWFIATLRVPACYRLYQFIIPTSQETFIISHSRVNMTLLLNILFSKSDTHYSAHIFLPKESSWSCLTFRVRGL